MSAQLIGAYAGIVVTLLGAITALVQALRAKSSAAIANGVAAHANNTVNDHIVKTHNAFPIQPATEQEPPLQ